LEIVNLVILFTNLLSELPDLHFHHFTLLVKGLLGIVQLQLLRVLDVTPHLVHLTLLIELELIDLAQEPLHLL
jgi:hypothetical protein